MQQREKKDEKKRRGKRKTRGEEGDLQRGRGSAHRRRDRRWETARTGSGQEEPSTGEELRRGLRADPRDDVAASGSLDQPIQRSRSRGASIQI